MPIQDPLVVRLLLICATALTAAWLLGVLAEPVTRVWRHATQFGRILFLLAGGVLCAFAGTKPPPLMMMRPRTQVPATVSDAEIDHGYRRVGVTTNAVDYSMPAGAVRNERWFAHGAYRAWFRLVLAPFVFPLCETNVEALAVFTDGKVRPAPRDYAHELGLASLLSGGESVPMLARPGDSELWSLKTDDNCVITWKSFYFNADTNTPVTLQLELFSNGDFLVRSNDVAFAHVRVDPRDWDGDGVPNVLDAHPKHWDGDAFGPHDILPEGANTNAYYTVKIVATGLNAEVEFAGDAPSSLSDPHFMARSGETNSVTLLKGKSYQIESSAPIRCFDASDEDTEIRTWSDGSYEIVRPIDISSDGGCGSFTMSVGPDDLGGDFVWTNVCCRIVRTEDDTFSFVCNRCGCGGCSANGFYEYEGYRRAALGGYCLCSSVEGNESPDGAGLSVPRCVFLNNDNARETEEDDLRAIAIALPSPDYRAESGTVTFRCTEGSDRIRLWSAADRTGPVGTRTYGADDTGERTVYLEGVGTSESVDDVAFTLSWMDELGRQQSIVRRTTVACVSNVWISCDFAGPSTNPPPFAGQREWLFDPANSTDVGKHLVVPFENVANPTNFAVRDFDVRLSLELAPVGFSLPDVDAVWTKLEDTPDSGVFTNVTGTTARFANPKVGGVYHFGVTYGGSPRSECNLVLPLAGADVGEVLRADLGRADSVIASSRFFFTFRDVHVIVIGGSMLSSSYAANYRGRADHVRHPTVWTYNGVRTESGFLNRLSNGDGAVVTLKGLPVRVAKLTNLLTGYMAQRLGAREWEHGYGQTHGTPNATSAQYSWNVGRDIAREADFDVATCQMVRDIWLMADEDGKARFLWPNDHTLDNYQSYHPYLTPDYDHCFYSPIYLNGFSSAFRDAYEDIAIEDTEE